MTIAVLHGGGRPNSNTETLTKIATDGLIVEDIYLRNYHIKPIIDKRHAPEGFSDVNDDYNKIIDQILHKDILIFSTPIYWYSMTSVMKNFIDRWSHTLRDERYPNFKELIAQKKAYVIAVGGDDPYIKGLPLIQQFHYIFDFVGIEFAGYLIGDANKPNEITNDRGAIADAERLRQKLKARLGQ